IPNRLGPILFFPASAVWQSAHFLKSALPASTSAAAAGRITKNSRRIPKPRYEIGNRILPPGHQFHRGSFALSSSRGPAQTSIHEHAGTRTGRAQIYDNLSLCQVSAVAESAANLQRGLAL